MLRQRVMTAIALVLVLGAILFLLPQEWAIAALACVFLGGAWEWTRLAGLRARPSRIGFIAAALLLMAVVWLVSGPIERFAAVMWVALAGWLATFAWMILMPASGHRLMVALAGLWILVPAWLALSRLYLQPGEGPALIIFTLLLISAADIGAYFAGRRYGQLKLAPTVSPNKTWEGVVGGTAVALAFAWAGSRWFELPPVPFISLCLAAVLASVVGDLVESMFKRQRGLKDSGALLPGHGGILDRIDSLTAAAPLMALGLVWLGRLT